MMPVIPASPGTVPTDPAVVGPFGKPVGADGRRADPADLARGQNYFEPRDHVGIKTVLIGEPALAVQGDIGGDGCGGRRVGKAVAQASDGVLVGKL